MKARSLVVWLHKYLTKAVVESYTLCYEMQEVKYCGTDNHLASNPFPIPSISCMREQKTLPFSLARGPPGRFHFLLQEDVRVGRKRRCGIYQNSVPLVSRVQLHWQHKSLKCRAPLFSGYHFGRQRYHKGESLWITAVKMCFIAKNDFLMKERFSGM